MVKWGAARDSRVTTRKINDLATKIIGNEVYHRFIGPASLNFIRGALVKWIG